MDTSISYSASVFILLNECNTFFGIVDDYSQMLNSVQRLLGIFSEQLQFRIVLEKFSRQA